MTDEMDEIWALYADDGGQALDTAEQALAQITSGPTEGQSEGIAALFRAVHTVKGNSRVLGLRVAESRAHLAEDLIGLIRDQGAPWDPEVSAILQLALDRMRAILETTSAQRQDVAEEIGADLMARLEDKIARMTAALNGAERPAATEDEAEALPEAQAQTPLADPAEPAAEEGTGATDAAPPAPAEGETVLHRILPLLAQVAEGGPPREAALAQIGRLAGDAGFARLSGLATALATTASTGDEREDVRLYEELYAIELAMAPAQVPPPRPRDLLSGWCADHVFTLIDGLRGSIDRLSQGGPMEPALREIEPALRRVQMACDHYGLDRAAQVSMALLDLVARMPATLELPPLAESPLADSPRADDTVLRMLLAFLSTVELALDSARAGEAPDQQGFDRLAGESGRIDFRRSGSPTPPEALETLDLPGQFLRVMSPRSVRIAQDSARAGLAFRVVRARFAEDAAAAGRFFDMMADGAIRQITSVSVLSERDVCFDFPLATSLDAASFAARLAQADAGEGRLEALPPPAAEGAAALPGPLVSPPHEEAPSAVSLEFMEIVGEVASGLAAIARDLRLAADIDLRARTITALADAAPRYGNMAGQDGALDCFMGQIDATLMTVDHLSRRVAALQEEAMKSRLRPAEHVLRPVLEDLRARLAAAGQTARINATIDPVPLDRQALNVLEAALERHLRQRMAGPLPENTVWDIRFRRRDDRVVLVVEDGLATPLDADLCESLAAEAGTAGGRASLEERPEGGCRLQLTLPLRMLAMEGMVVASAGVHYVLPIEAVISVLSAGADRVIRRAAAGGERFLHLPSGAALPIIVLEGGTPDKGGLFVVIEAEGQRRAVLVDALLGQEVVRLRPLQGVLARLDRVAGLAILAGGEVALVLSALTLCASEAEERPLALQA